MAKPKTRRAPRVRRARPLLLVAAGLSLTMLNGCNHFIGNPGCSPQTCREPDASMPSLTPEPDLATSQADGGAE
jgi:hypothetical protein